MTMLLSLLSATSSSALGGTRGNPRWAVGPRDREHAAAEGGPQNNPTMGMLHDLLCKFDAELSKVFPGGGQVVTDDRDILLNVENDRGDIRALVPNVLHILPLHLKMGIQEDKPLDPSQENSLLCYPGQGRRSGSEARACGRGRHFISGRLSYPVCSG